MWWNTKRKSWFRKWNTWNDTSVCIFSILLEVWWTSVLVLNFRKFGFESIYRYILAWTIFSIGEKEVKALKSLRVTLLERANLKTNNIHEKETILLFTICSEWKPAFVIKKNEYNIVNTFFFRIISTNVTKCNPGKKHPGTGWERKITWNKRFTWFQQNTEGIIGFLS